MEMQGYKYRKVPLVVVVFCFYGLYLHLNVYVKVGENGKYGRARIGKVKRPEVRKRGKRS